MFYLSIQESWEYCRLWKIKWIVWFCWPFQDYVTIIFFFFYSKWLRYFTIFSLISFTIDISYRISFKTIIAFILENKSTFQTMFIRCFRSHSYFRYLIFTQLGINVNSNTRNPICLCDKEFYWFFQRRRENYTFPLALYSDFDIHMEDMHLKSMHFI